MCYLSARFFSPSGFYLSFYWGHLDRKLEDTTILQSNISFNILYGASAREASQELTYVHIVYTFIQIYYL